MGNAGNAVGLFAPDQLEQIYANAVAKSSSAGLNQFYGAKAAQAADARRQKFMDWSDANDVTENDAKMKQSLVALVSAHPEAFPLISKIAGDASGVDTDQMFKELGTLFTASRKAGDMNNIGAATLNLSNAGHTTNASGPPSSLPDASFSFTGRPDERMNAANNEARAAQTKGTRVEIDTATGIPKIVIPNTAPEFADPRVQKIIDTGLNQGASGGIPSVPSPVPSVGAVQPVAPVGSAGNAPTPDNAWGAVASKINTYNVPKPQQVEATTYLNEVRKYVDVTPATKVIKAADGRLYLTGVKSKKDGQVVSRPIQLYDASKATPVK
jgi:hypothetical protein